jgi:hypothetical protein
MSDRKAAAAKRRDARATKVEAETIRAPGGHRKDRKKWCRGKAGVEHVPVCMKAASAVSDCIIEIFLEGRRFRDVHLGKNTM